MVAGGSLWCRCAFHPVEDRLLPPAALPGLSGPPDSARLLQPHLATKAVTRLALISEIRLFILVHFSSFKIVKSSWDEPFSVLSLALFCAHACFINYLAQISKNVPWDWRWWWLVMLRNSLGFWSEVKQGGGGRLCQLSHYKLIFKYKSIIQPK